MTRNKEVETGKSQFTKEQILRSKGIYHSQDILNILLSDKRTYSIDEINDLVKKFKERKVK